MAASEARADLRQIAALAPSGAKVLDVGCGDGALLLLLARDKNIEGRGIELDQRNVNACVARGLFVVQGDADHDLDMYPDKAFDLVVLSQTIQATRHPRDVLMNLLRIGKRVIVSFPNFGHWRVRLQLLFNGRMPVTGTLPAQWYETDNLHLCTVADFVALADAVGARIERIDAFDVQGAPLSGSSNPRWLNLAAGGAMFTLSRD
ncbi:MAG: methionine biosynthesis protein MetW [Pseudomonadota bacterium]